MLGTSLSLITRIQNCLGAFTSNTTRKLHVFGHDGDTLRVHGTQIRVFEETDEIRFRGFLEREHGSRLETKIRPVFLGDLLHETLEGDLANQKFGGLLVLADLAESDRARAVPSRLLDSARLRSGFARCLCCELRARRLSTGALACGLLRACHENGVPSTRRVVRSRQYL